MSNILNEMSCDESQLISLYDSDQLLKLYSKDGYFSKGKNIRGKLCYIIGKHLNINPIDSITSVAKITDLLHNASLVHDDIIDGDMIRRGQPSIWYKYGVGKALLVGDYLISKSYNEVSMMDIDSSAMNTLNAEITKTLNDTIKGAHLELLHSNDDIETTFNKYIEITTLKTGSLFSLPFRCLYNISEKYESLNIKPVVVAFSNLAVAYQIKDDWIDFKTEEEDFQNNSDIANSRPNIFNVLSDTHRDELELRVHEYQKNLIEKSWEPIKQINCQLFNDLNKVLGEFIKLGI